MSLPSGFPKAVLFDLDDTLTLASEVGGFEPLEEVIGLLEGRQAVV